MSVKETGGAAFPHSVVELYGGDKYPTPYNGMTLRDYFAGQIICGLFANSDLSKYTSEEGYEPADVEADYVKTAYKAADAMITERSK